MEMITKTKSNHWDLQRYHFWGFPVYALETKLQNNQELPKWNWRSHLGQFIGFSEEHSTLVANFCHLRTGYISPQYHLVFDNFFDTSVRLGDNDPAIENICNDIFDSRREWYAEEEFEYVGQLIYPPPTLSEVWLDECGRRERKEKMGKQRLRREQ